MKLKMKTVLLGTLMLAVTVQPMQAMSYWNWYKEELAASVEILGWEKVALIVGVTWGIGGWLRIKYKRQIDMRALQFLGLSKDRQLYNAIQDNDIERAKYLLSYAAHIQATDIEKGTPLHWAVLNNHPEMVKFLLENGANIYADDSNKGTPLHYAAMENRPAMVKCLIESGVNVNIISGKGYTPLHLAAYFHDNVETVQYMLGNGAHIHAIDDAIFTARHRAEEQGNVNVTALLQSCENYCDRKIRMKVTEHNKNVVPPYLALDVYAQDIEGMRDSFNYLFSGVDQGSDEFGQNIKLVNHLLHKTEQMKLTSVNKELAFLKMKLGNQKPTIHSEFDAHNKLRLVVIKNRTNTNDLFFTFTNLN